MRVIVIFFCLILLLNTVSATNHSSSNDEVNGIVLFDGLPIDGANILLIDAATGET